MKVGTQDYPVHNYSALRLEFAARVEKPEQDPLNAALELVRSELGKGRYDQKEKWLKFFVEGDKDEAFNFLKLVRSRLAAQHRRSYGNSRTFTAMVTFDEAGEPVLYVKDEY